MSVQLKAHERERKREREYAKEEILSCDKSQFDMGNDRLVERRISDDFRTPSVL